VIEVLVYLAENPDETVSKERLIRVVWRDTFVTDDVLNPLHLGAAGEERSWLGVCFMAPAC
jgi:hypothetical protein